ncbi:BrnA antitoxin of type II toxin-antitoxin system [Roseiarcus fermentans]|uniref:BrnA antitoxin of type II toxin-antitoxin system n=1 Tax=Roseiarcus fermentans TaxID=1473586 RepID=A0A366F378_9HYPH|nr:BrnA antitoxin family protein [Roseiarcus fermentans]RBP09123.1 BrnA antitoxin of type II toxin-antitoxin system [Roseiarcus fermentans]
MRTKLVRPTASEDARIARGVAADPDAAPDLSEPVEGIVRRPGRPLKADRKVSVTLRLDRDVVERFKATGAGWQTRINAALKRAKSG